MASSPAPESRREERLDIKDLVFSYSSRTWRTLLGLLPFPSSNLLPRIAWPRRARRRKPVLPLPLHSSVVRYPPIAAEASRVFVILEDILDHTLSNLHTIQKSLLFWQRREEGTNAQKIYFMIFERGPRAFIDGTYQILSRSVSDGSPIQYLCQSAADTISDRISVLTSLQHCLATFLAEIYLEVNKFGELLTTGSEKSLPILLLAINSLFSKLEASISHLHVIYKGEDPLSSDGGNSRALLFEKWPKMDQERSEWTDTEIRDATNLIYKNLQRLDSYISFILSSCRKPGRMTLYWLHYTCGAVGLSVCSLWLLRHSSLMGSSDIDNWIREVKESTAGFYKDHVEQPPLICQTSPANSARYGSGVSLAGIMLGEIMDEIGGCLASVLKYASRQYGMSCSKGYASNCTVIAICLQASGKATMNLAFGDELFETFRRRHKGVMEVEEVELTANSLHRMLLAFTEQVKDQKLPDNISDQEMLEVVMARYEKEVMHPLQNLLSGELARAMLIQIQKLKLDLETAMLELDQILKANEINFAILAALPAFFLSLILLMLIRAWVLQDKGAEGRGRIARLQRRLLLVEVEKHLMQFEMCMDQGLEEDAQCMFGLVLYNLDRLYKAVERHAKETGEWMSFRQDIVDLVKPDLKTMYKLSVVSRMGRMYDCLLPSSKHR